MVPFASENGRIRTIVIDPGHGGHDPGALGRQSKEKTINLAIALKLGNLIQRNLKDVRVIYTRDRDRFVELFKRAEIANRNKADLFISIHCNANNNRTLRGAETYIMGLHRSKANLDIAKLENAAILLESDYSSSYDGFDPNSDESYILFSLYQNANLGRSTDLAAAIQERMTEKSGRRDRGVRQAGFLVLYKTAMPSVLVEAGYISHAEEEKYLASARGQEFIADAIFGAVKEYLDDSKPTLRDTGESREHPDSAVEKEAKQTDRPAPAPKSSEKKSPVEYRIQVATSARELGKEASVYRDFKNVSVYRQSGLFKYTVGKYTDYDKANAMLDAVRKKGYKDAFLVVFRNNERLPQAEADQYLRK